MMKDRFSVLRQLLAEPPSEEVWRDLWEWLQHCSRLESDMFLMREYAERHLEDWDEELRVIETDDPWRYLRDESNLDWLFLARSLVLKGYPHSTLFESLVKDQRWESIRHLTLSPSVSPEDKLEKLRECRIFQLESLTMDSRYWNESDLEILLSSESCQGLQTLRCLFSVESMEQFADLLRDFELKRGGDWLHTLELQLPGFSTSLSHFLLNATQGLQHLTLHFWSIESEGWEQFFESSQAQALQTLHLNRQYYGELYPGNNVHMELSGFLSLQDFHMDRMPTHLVLEAAATLNREPLQSLSLNGWNLFGDLIDALLEGDSFPQLKRLKLSGCFEFAPLQRLFESSLFPALETLELEIPTPLLPDFDKLLQTVCLPSLKHLSVEGGYNHYTLSTASQLWLERVHRIESSDNTGTSLQSLSLLFDDDYMNRREVEWVGRILKLPLCSRLRCLSLISLRLNDERLKYLLQLPVFRGLLDLDLSSNHISDDGIRSLVEAKGLEGLRKLDISDNEYTEKGEALLLESELIRQLWFLRD